MSLSSSILGSKELHKLGSPLVGTLVATGLWGVAFASTALYYQRFPKDRLPFQLLVGLVAFIDFLHTAFLIAATVSLESPRLLSSPDPLVQYHRFVDNFGDALASLKLDWREAALLPLLSVIALCVQGFFAWRCYAMMERRVILPIIIGVACLFTLAFSGVYTQRNHDPQNFIKNTLDRPDGYFMTAVSLPAASVCATICSRKAYLMPVFKRMHSLWRACVGSHGRTATPFPLPE